MVIETSRLTYKRQDRNNWEMNRLGLKGEPAPQPDAGIWGYACYHTVR